MTSHQPQGHDTSTVDPFALFAELYHEQTASNAMRSLCRRTRVHCGMHEPPFGLMAITKLLNVQVEFGSSLSGRVQGQLERTESGYLIKVSAHLSWRRARSTIAHELGHILLLRSLARYPQAVRALRSPACWEEVEALCDLAAAELLLPLDDLWGYAFPDFLEVYSSELHIQLYDRYMVSMRALLQRYLDVGADAVVLWRVQLGENPIWRVSTAYHRQTFFIPQKMSAKKHLLPNIFEGVPFEDVGWRRDCPDIQFQLQQHVLRARCTVVDARPRRSQPTFEGFSVPDETLGPSAIMLLKLLQ